ncbi:MAG: tetratricopeptide repeat protein [Candidatus Latescibacterota bacterium]
MKVAVDCQKLQGGDRARAGLAMLATLVLVTSCHQGGDSNDTGEVEEKPPAVAATVVFTDVTQAAGIEFHHTNGSSGRKYVVETMGSGAAALDYDVDGFVDLYVVDSGTLPGFTGLEAGRNALLRNGGPASGWTFADHAAEAGVDDRGYGMGVTVGDYDNDQDPDIFVTNVGANRLFRNESGGISGSLRFEDVSGSSDIGLDTSWSTGAAFCDVDLDGDLDLYVANYLEFSFPPADSGPGRPRRHIAPTEYPGRRDFLYRNDGDGQFVDITEAAGLSSLEGRQLGVIFLDFDDDGDPDLFQGNDATPNGLFRNEGDGTFVDVGLLAGVAFNGSGKPEGTMGVDAGDVDGDGRQDLVMTNFQWESNTLYQATSPGSFDDVSRESGVGGSSFDRLAFGINLFDADNDGDQDLFVANGHIDEDIERFDPQAAYGQPNQLYLNDGAGRFEDVSAVAGEAFAVALVSRGSVAFDYDDDGDQDLFVVNSGQPARLLRNDASTGNHWLALQLVGRFTNRDGFGARVRVACGGSAWLQEHRSGVSYLSQDDPRLHFGLGPCTAVDSVTIRWPSGRTQALKDVAVDRVLRIEEPSGARTSTAALPGGGSGDHADISVGVDSLQISAAWERAPMVLPAEVRVQRGVPDLSSARIAFESARRKGESLAAARLDYAEALRVHRRHADAEALYLEAMQSLQTRASASTGLGQLEMSQGNLVAALSRYRDAIAADDDLADPHYYSGNLLVRQGDLGAAAAAYEAALTRDPLHLRSYVNLASAHARQTDYGPAVETLRRGLRALPEAGELRQQLARILFVQTRYDEAAEQLRRLIEAGKAGADVFSLIARIESDRGRPTEALDWLRRGLREVADDAQLRTQLGGALVAQDSLQEALPHLERAVELDPDLEEARYHLGRLYLHLGMRVAGEASLGRFQRLQTHHTDLLDFKTAIVLNPDDARAYYSLGAVYSRIGRLEAAWQAYRAALTIDPGHRDALNNLGNIHLRRREVRAALVVFRRLLVLDSTYVRGHNNLGNAWLLAGEPRRAARSFQRAVDLDPDYAPAQTALARLRAGGP